MSDLERLTKSYLPMSESSFMLLISLIQENHGYGIMQRAAALTNGRVTLGAGTVYTLLYKMENDGLIRSVREEDRRKVYVITELGLEILRQEGMRLGELAGIAQGLGITQRPMAEAHH